MHASGQLFHPAGPKPDHHRGSTERCLHPTPRRHSPQQAVARVRGALPGKQGPHRCLPLKQPCLPVSSLSLCMCLSLCVSVLLFVCVVASKKLLPEGGGGGGHAYTANLFLTTAFSMYASIPNHTT